MSINELQKTGIPFFDNLVGGIPRGSRNLFIGPPGTGKTVFGMHFLWAGLRAGEVVSYDVFDRPWPHIRRYFQSFGWDVVPHEEEKKLLPIQAFPHYEPFKKDSHVRYFDLPDFEAMRSLDLELTEAGCTRFLFGDGYTHLFNTMDEEQWRAVEYWTVNWSHYSNMTNIDIVNEFEEASPVARRLMDFTRYLGHNIIRFRVRETGGRMRREMRIEKMEGVEHPIDWMPFRITSSGIEAESEGGEPLLP